MNEFTLMKLCRETMHCSFFLDNAEMIPHNLASLKLYGLLSKQLKTSRRSALPLANQAVKGWS